MGPTWTLQMLRSVVKQVLRLRLSLNSLWTLRHEFGVRWGGLPTFRQA